MNRRQLKGIVEAVKESDSGILVPFIRSGLSGCDGFVAGWAQLRRRPLHLRRGRVPSLTFGILLCQARIHLHTYRSWKIVGGMLWAIGCYRSLMKPPHAGSCCNPDREHGSNRVFEYLESCQLDGLLVVNQTENQKFHAKFAMQGTSWSRNHAKNLIGIPLPPLAATKSCGQDAIVHHNLSCQGRSMTDDKFLDDCPDSPASTALSSVFGNTEQHTVSTTHPIVGRPHPDDGLPAGLDMRRSWLRSHLHEVFRTIAALEVSAHEAPASIC